MLRKPNFFHWRMKHYNWLALILLVVFFMGSGMALASKPAGRLTDVEKLAQLEEQLRTYQAEYFHRYMLAHNQNLVVTRVTPREAPYFHTYTCTTVFELSNTLTYEYLTSNISTEKIREKTKHLVKIRLGASNRVKNHIKESELPQIQKLINSTRRRIIEIESSSQEPEVRIKHLRKEIEYNNKNIEALEKLLEEKDFVFPWLYPFLLWQSEAWGYGVAGFTIEELEGAVMSHWLDLKIDDPSFIYNKESLIKLIGANNKFRNYFKDHVIGVDKRNIERWTKEIAALEAEIKREKGDRMEVQPSAVVPSLKPVFNGRWRIHYQGWYILEIEESNGKVSGEIWHENDTKRGDGSLSGERLHNLVIGSASPQDGIRGEFDMVKEIQEYDRDARKYYPTLVQHDFKSFKFRVEGGNTLRGELCFRAKGGGESVCRAVGGNKVE
jgi:hypothetical protein